MGSGFELMIKAFLPHPCDAEDKGIPMGLAWRLQRREIGGRHSMSAPHPLLRATVMVYEGLKIPIRVRPRSKTWCAFPASAFRLTDSNPTSSRPFYFFAIVADD